MYKLSAENSKRINQAVSLLNKIGVKNDDLIIVGSSVVALISNRKPGDIDIALRPSVYKEVLCDPHLKNEVIPESGTINLNTDAQILRNRYAEVRVTDKELFENSSMTVSVDKYKFARPEIEFAKNIQGA